MSRRSIAVLLVCSVLCGALLTGCCIGRAKRVGVLAPIQLRMADPLVLPDDSGSLNPPVVVLQQYAIKKPKKEKRPESKNAKAKESYPSGQRRGATTHEDEDCAEWKPEAPAEVTVVERTRPLGKPRAAAFVLDSEPFKNRVDLVADAVYKVTIVLPSDFEKRRLALLQLKTETLYAAIEEADAKLGENTEGQAQLLDEETRASLIRAGAHLGEEIAQRQQNMTIEGESANAIASETCEGVAYLAANDERLREDDVARDKLLSPALTTSLVDQIEEWRAELNRLKARIVALEMMTKNTNEPYPRIINGWLQTKDQTSFTMAGAIPFVVEDEYLDWIRRDRVVTIVSYDPNEPPENEDAAGDRAALARYWPEDKLMVIEFSDKPTGLPRDEYAGTRSSTRITEKVYPNVKAATYAGDDGSERTYLSTEDGKKVWVFGPDLNSPPNLEVWAVGETGDLVQKLYPPNARESADEVFIRQIAGVDGGAFDPIEEARRRGKVVAITRLGNKRETSDTYDIQEVYPRELEHARSK